MKWLLEIAEKLLFLVSFMIDTITNAANIIFLRSMRVSPSFVNGVSLPIIQKCNAIVFTFLKNVSVSEIIQSLKMETTIYLSILANAVG